jgi:hypothetical protein
VWVWVSEEYDFKCKFNLHLDHLTLGKWLNLSTPQFPSAEHGEIRFLLHGLLCGANMMDVSPFVIPCISKYSINSRRRSNSICSSNNH